MLLYKLSLKDNQKKERGVAKRSFLDK